MRIVWDEPKRLANLAKHRLDFADLQLEFFQDILILPAKKERFQAVGKLSGEIIVVIFAPLGTEALSIISMRPARKNERKLV